VTLENNEAMYGADNAIDMDLSTYSYAKTAGNVNTWFRASLDKEHCIKQVVHYWTYRKLTNTHTCSKDTCTCEGAQCTNLPLRVYHQTTVSGDNVLSGCKLGDTVEITDIENDEGVFIYEIVIFTTPKGSLLNSLTLSYAIPNIFPEAHPTM